ncbi:MAG: Hsp20/alpha crystallin family protein [Acidimicrobiia bacterium]|nr:Hsp20/alpha crystallin family protein [Acidimicrobiia bacterium]
MTKETSGTDSAVAVKTAHVPSSAVDPFERFGLGEIFTRWPTWLGTHWPDRLMGDTGGFRVEEYMDDDELVIRGEIPGVDPKEDIEIAVDSGRLCVRAEREEKSESHDGGYRSEFRYGSFERILTLPEGAEPDDISATYTDGILEVRVPVDKDASTSKRIAVTRG